MSTGPAPQRPAVGETFDEVLDRYQTRRGFLQAAAGTLAVLAVARHLPGRDAPLQLEFSPVPPVPAAAPFAQLRVPEGYAADVLIRWGDALFEGVADLNPADQDQLTKQTAADQAKRFGYNCDFVGFLPLDDDAAPDGRPAGNVLKAGGSTRGLLVVNHEYTNPELMFPGYNPKAPRAEEVKVEWAAHGLSVVEVRLEDNRWAPVKNSAYNRRITATTEMVLTGPAAGHALLKTAADPTGTKVLGTLNNCAGGNTPWGTVLSGEENFQLYFAMAKGDALHEAYGLSAGPSERKWEGHDKRFDVSQEPNEPNRFGWAVEVDPYDPKSTPAKRTALGRIRHEAATCVPGREGKPVVVYTGDDEKFQCVYKFISTKAYQPDAPRDELMKLLDEGTLYVARFKDDGTGEWLPLDRLRQPALQQAFEDQGDVLIQTRRAAHLLGGTLMDRPEDIETDPRTGKVYVVLTNNDDRCKAGKDKPNQSNPRPENKYGHIIQLSEKDGDHAAEQFAWTMLLLGGPPAHPTLSCPDNVAFNGAHDELLWVSTDGAPKAIEHNDGLFAVPLTGAARGVPRQFLSAPTGSEVCGPEFTPDGTTLFVAIQHPGEGKDSTALKPISHWPDGRGVPRPSVVAIRKDGGGRIGT